MPIYDYKCVGCGCVWEELRSIESRDAEAICPRWYYHEEPCEGVRQPSAPHGVVKDPAVPRRIK